MKSRTEQNEPTGRTDRGQTPNDYLLGIVILLLSIILVFGYFPSIFQPFEQQVGNEEQAMANNLAAEIVENSTVGGNEQTVDFVLLNQTVDSYFNNSEQAGIPRWLNWNVTVIDNDGNRVNLTLPSGPNKRIQNGTTWRGERAESTIRFVAPQDSSQVSGCTNGCRIVVRVW
jgi:hypothetical protein